ncbi:unnamed protein product [Thelazia callipaeda]|uniref:Transmembrane protein 98 n=1 Tax=Thelazia callipaeda TaxID=103827 RepID=A0A0N5CWD6_THECL|nr:unnamed protein product [Thelazia callipaeda]
MEVVVYLALFVLASVFFSSSCILIIMCRRRAQTRKRLRIALSSLRFMKANNGDVESVVHLGPLIAQIFENNQWIFDVSGMLQHCVLVLKLCHTLTEKLSTIQLMALPPKLNEQIVIATSRVMPRFDDLMRTMAAAQVDARLLEACASSLVSACWALAFPFTVISPKHIDSLHGILIEMEDHVEALRLMTHHMEENNQIQNKDTCQKSSSPFTVVVEETALTEPSMNRNDSITESQHSDEAPADPIAPIN